ncbi:hypothetical protein [Hymenobacter canadensis]|uniref:MotA/TolQ/ExbB proton channel domain-containing protein n=1 Tax=Hymenobacter canadensis TaxID=2999067 RepID=A0ABY7LW56_9BACT|nr:hypothetical protein [Hymenobacter canadensis]WBA44321.1 hypothetical protein O3303_21175 [Hymenobacter canadensis]
MDNVEQGKVVEISDNETLTPKNDESIYKWQVKLLPFIIRMLVGFSMVFFIGSFIQLYYLHARINNSPAFTLGNTFNQLAEIKSQSHQTNQDLIAATRWQTLSVLEASALQRRYHQANVLLMSRVWITYLGFVTGMILALVGAVFVLGKFRETTTKGAIDTSGAKVSFESASPGLILAGLGTLLMFTTMITHYDIEVKDGPSYIDQWGTYSKVTLSQPEQSKPEKLPPNSGFSAGKDDEILDTTNVSADSALMGTKKRAAGQGE